MLPKDPYILLSLINTKLRDYYNTLGALCEDLNIEESDLKDQLESIGYHYIKGRNQFIAS